MNDGTIAFLTSLVIALTWNILLLFSFWHKTILWRTKAFFTTNYKKNIKLQSCKIKLEKWHEPSNKSEIARFYPGKNSKISGSFTWGCFMQHRLQWFLLCCFWSPYFFNNPFCGRPCCKTSIICISCWSRWFTGTNP